jgi:UDP-2,3-diacylglucosamine hydrolase
MQIPARKKVYFLSDFHLGCSRQGHQPGTRESVVRFLDEAMKDAAMIFIVGDSF